MLIIPCRNFSARWLVFSKFRVMRWGWVFGTISVFIGAMILATFMALFNYLLKSNYEQATANVAGLAAQASILVWISSYTAYL